VTESVAARTERIARFLDSARGAACALCDRAVCGHEALLSFATGRQDAPLCLACLAEDSARPAAALRDEMARYVLTKECLTTGWESASRREGFAPGAAPRCLWPAGSPSEAVSAKIDAAPTTAGEAPPAAAAAWDAGDLGCGDLVLELRRRLAAVAAGEVLKLTARDPGAPEDLPAWCRLTGNELVGARGADYWIRRRD
jgi:tRNA 2-thiouridine synthesizing protein A